MKELLAMQLKNSYESYILLWNHWVKVVLYKIISKMAIKYYKIDKKPCSNSHTCKCVYVKKLGSLKY